MRLPGKKYLVGGMVRDELMGVEANSDRDWVITGATEAEMLDAGFRRIGRSFPVFLHPRTKEEYALARREQKTAPGHAGFEFTTGPEVSIEQDLRRRDLTVNAMARGDDGSLIDPYGGRRDLEAKILRHVSDAFAEDPLRVFRVARFASSFPDFNVAEETNELMRNMQPELIALAPERVWLEYEKSMSSLAPFRFFEVLNDSDCLDPWFDEINIFGLIALLRERWMREMNAVAALGWVSDEESTVAQLAKLKAPGKFVRVARNVAKFGHDLSSLDSASPDDILTLFERCGAFRPGIAFFLLVEAVESCAGVSLQNVLELVETVKNIRLPRLPSAEYGYALREARRAAIESYWSP